MSTIIRSFYLSLLTAEKAARYEALNKSLGVRRQSHEEATKQQPPGTILTAPPLALSRPTSGEGCLINNLLDPLVNLGATPIAPTAAKTWKTPASASAATQGAAAGNVPSRTMDMSTALRRITRGSPIGQNLPTVPHVGFPRVVPISPSGGHSFSFAVAIQHKPITQI